MRTFPSAFSCFFLLRHDGPGARRQPPHDRVERAAASHAGRHRGGGGVGATRHRTGAAGTGGAAAAWVRVRTSGGLTVGCPPDSPGGSRRTHGSRRSQQSSKIAFTSGRQLRRARRIARPCRTHAATVDGAGTWRTVRVALAQRARECRGSDSAHAGRKEPYAGWLKAHERVMFCHEMAGRWQVRQAGGARFARSPSGHVVCRRHRVVCGDARLARRVRGVRAVPSAGAQRPRGTSLRLHPAGRHVGGIGGALSAGVQLSGDEPRRILRPGQGLRGAGVVATPLEAAVSATRAAARTDALAVLARLRAPCK